MYAAAIAVITIALPREAMAYLDPGTGSLLLQGLISLLATLAVSVTLGWTYVKRTVLRLFCRKAPPGNSLHNSDE